ncbi:MAG TPA: ABC transporter ATP-binding protein [Armatimonadota bacterium]|jgi:putative ABC transport system ATP-binding protein
MIHCLDVEKHYASPVLEAALHWRLGEFHVAQGESVLVTGPSGCGKTTLLHLLAGLLRPDAGEITIDGLRVDLLDTSAADIFRGQHIGLVFQSFHLLAPLTVLDNLLLGARFGRKWDSREALSKAHALLEQVGLAGRKGHRPGQLSLGEQQRVAIARALINEPPLLLADEPTASLDKANSLRILDLLFQLCAQHGTTLVAVSHDLSMADRFDRSVDAEPWMSLEQREACYV